MGLIQETNAQYYAGQEILKYSGGVGGTLYFDFNTVLELGAFNSYDPASPDYALNNFKIYRSPTAIGPFEGVGSTWTEITNPYSVEGNTFSFTTAIFLNTVTFGGAGSILPSGDIRIVDPGVSYVGDFNGFYLQTDEPSGYSQITAVYDGVSRTELSFAGNYTGPAIPPSNSISLYDLLIPDGSFVGVQVKQEALWNNYGGYQYVTLEDVINNFMMMYIGKDKIISQAPRGDVIFHAKRGLQEFSFDTLRSIKSQEVTVPDSLSVIIPQDYVNYVELSWIDMAGVKHIIYPTDLTINPYETPIQDGTPEGVPIQDHWGENLEGTSLTEERWDNQRKDFTIEPILDPLGLGNNWYRYWDVRLLGQRYGLLPEYAQRNGWFTIDDRKGKLSFSSVLHKKLITIEYISDGLAYDQDTKIPKMAETALYMHILHGILSTRANVPEYTIQRFKKERRAALRNAKIRLSNIKLDEFVQVMRGKSKWIKY